MSDAIDRDVDVPLDPARVLSAILRRKPDGSAEALEAPLTPLLDTTLLDELARGTGGRSRASCGDPLVGRHRRRHGVRSVERNPPSARSASSSLPGRQVAAARHDDVHEQHGTARARRVGALGAEIKVSYDTASTRLHAKAWLFHRRSGYSTAYIGSSNLTHSAMVTGLEWNVRVSGVRNPDVVAKMTAVFDSYWASGDFVPFDRDEFRERTARDRARADASL